MKRYTMFVALLALAQLWRGQPRMAPPFSKPSVPCATARMAKAKLDLS